MGPFDLWPISALLGWNNPIKKPLPEPKYIYQFPYVTPKYIEEQLEIGRRMDEDEEAFLAEEALGVPHIPETLPTKVIFKQGEPQHFRDYIGQAHITKPLQAAIDALQPDETVIRHRLFTGIAGLGKSLLAKVAANEMQERAERLGLPPVAFTESFGVDLATPDALDNLAWHLLDVGGGVWFIDEIHVLSHALSTKLFALMEDSRYPFQGRTELTEFPPVCIIGATTEYGLLHPALRRRFGEPMMVRTLSPDELRTVVANRGMHMTSDAMDLLISRTHWSGAPWESLVLRQESEMFALARGASEVAVEDVREVLETYNIDDYGLRWEDRKILSALFRRPNFRGKAREFVCYGASESDVCAVAGLDVQDYRANVKPRLLARNLIEVRKGYGQALTEEALKRYDSLRPQELPC